MYCHVRTLFCQVTFQNHHVLINKQTDFLLHFQLYDRFQKSGISLSHQSMLNILDLIGGHYSDGLVDLIKSKRKCHVVGDNLNIKTNVKDMRMDNRNKMHNWFMSVVVSERVDASSLDNTQAIAEMKNFPNENYLLSDAKQ